MMQDSQTISSIRGLLSEKLFAQVDSPDADLLKAGVLDSLALIQLLVHIEERFDVKIALDELDVEDLRSVASLASLVDRQRALQLSDSRPAVSPARRANG